MRFVPGVVAFLAACAVAGTALAQAYPTRLIKLIVPYAPGGGTDISARAIAAQVSVSLAMLTERWRGDFATLRRAPEGYAEKTINGRARPGADWLSTQLAKVAGTGSAIADNAASAAVALTAGGSPEAALRAKVYAFQLANGLAPDGQAGPMTLMQLNRATGVNEPHLASDKADKAAGKP